MKTINIVPHQGIGDIIFGMTRQQVEHIISYKHYYEDKMLISDCIGVRYEDYHVTYKENKVVEIGINEPLDCTNTVLFNGIDMFRTKAEKVVDTLRKLSEYDCDCCDEYLSSTYYFKKFNMSLWRESAFHPKLLKQDWFLKLVVENEEYLEYEQRFWYFQQICLRDSSMTTIQMEKIPFHIGDGITCSEECTPTSQELRKLTSKYDLK